MKNALSIDKRSLWRYVNRKIQRVIYHYHVLSIITILFDEMLADLKKGKTIKITNFGSLSLKKMPPRKYHNVRYKRVMSSNGQNLLRLTLSPSLRKELCSHLNVKEL